jgi:hypothetical protein
VTDVTASTIAIQKAIERTRQEKEIFEQRLTQERRWFYLRLTMGYVVVALLPTIACISGYILLNPAGYSSSTLSMAGAALFVDVFGLVAGMFKVVMPPQNAKELTPVTEATDLNQLTILAGQSSINQTLPAASSSP